MLVFKRLYKRFAKKHLYEVLKEKSKTILPWGNLTGIRPVKLYNQTVLEMGEEKADDYFINFYDVTRQKLDVVKEITKVQKKYLLNDGNTADIYVGIPFCKGKCSYCSFFSADIEKNKNLTHGYVNCLIEEIKCVKDVIDKNNIKINSIYIGGGTPSSLPLNYLEKILKELKNISTKEFTVEAGRPDSINKELLEVLKFNKVGRISINPQTANDKTLKLIGRKHTFYDILKAYELAVKYGFIINMDIIAGLPEETLEDFMFTSDSVIRLMPDNITVHTLAIKQGADLNLSGYKHKSSVDKMLDYADGKLHKNGFYAYYMYRQKNTAGNLENTGYCLNGKECRYNIDNMEDTLNIVACGANAISKRIFEKGRIERQDTPKDIKTYCQKIEIIKENKIKFLNI